MKQQLKPDGYHTMRYPEVIKHAYNEGVCTVCGKKGIRRQTIVQTVHPFNLSCTGSPKTVEEVEKELTLAASAWEKEPFVHIKCEGKQN